MTPAQRAALAEVEHAASDLLTNLWLLALSVDVILSECREMRGEAGPDPMEGRARLVVVTRGGRL